MQSFWGFPIQNLGLQILSWWVDIRQFFLILQGSGRLNKKPLIQNVVSKWAMFLLYQEHVTFWLDADDVLDQQVKGDDVLDQQVKGDDVLDQ